MKFQVVIQMLGRLLALMAVIVQIPAIVAYIYNERVLPFEWTSLVALILGSSLMWLTRRVHLRFSPKEAFGVVSIGWILLSVVAAFPFLFYCEGSQAFNFVDAVFESISGLTTTGASILVDIEALPHSILFWRSLLHWLGGMGIIMLFLAILPALGAGGFQLFRAEIPGPTKDKMHPKITKTAKVLYLLYLAISLVVLLALKLCGMSWFDASCHMFGAVSTGGFSTHNASVASFNSVPIDLTLTAAMFVCGCNFALILMVLKGDWRAPWKNDEFKLFVVIISVVTLSTSGLLHFQMGYTWLHALRQVLFQVVSIMTCTGFGTDDYDLWPNISKLMILGLMFIGACAGSTGGGMKVYRLLIVFKSCAREIKQLLYPRGVLQIRVDQVALTDPLIRVVLGFVCLYFVTFGAFGLFLVANEGMRFDIISLLSICASCQAGVGPGLDAFGPTDNYAQLYDSSKIALCFLMLLGRLELFSMFALFHRDFWRH